MYYTWKSLPVCVYPRNIAVARNTGSPYTSHWRTDGRYASYLEHTAQLLMSRSGESGLVTERIGGESPIHILDHQRLGSRLHFQLHISPCTPPQGGEETIISPISQYLIPVPDKLLIRQLVRCPLPFNAYDLVVDSSSCL